MSLGKSLYELRKQRGLSQEDVAQELYVSRQTISKWESDLSSPDFEKLISLSKFYHISLDELANQSQENNGIRERVIYKEYYYEYKSKLKIGNVPLIHVVFAHNLKAKAKGIIAVGPRATGIIAIGFLSVGLLAMGCLSFGLFAIGALALALFSIGGLSIGGVAFGGVAFGVLAMGGFAFGIYSIGGLAFGSKVALGDQAFGHIAIGNSPHGAFEFFKNNYHFEFNQIKELILEEFPHTWKFIVDVFNLIH